MNNNNGIVPKTMNEWLESALANHSSEEVMLHFLGHPLLGAPAVLNTAAIVCMDIEWWQKEPKPTTEIGIAELTTKGCLPSVHAETILTNIQVAHARIMPHAHLLNHFVGAGDPERFHFGNSKFVTKEESKRIVLDTFVRKSNMFQGTLQPIILIGHAVENEFDHILRSFSVDLRQYGTIVKVIDTQVMARNAGIRGPRGPNIGLGDLLAHFNIHIDNLHTAGNDAAGTLIAAILIALQPVIYPFCYGRPPAVVEGRNIQDVVYNVMWLNKLCPFPSWGRFLFCTRCSRGNHLRQQCYANVFCTICRNSNVKRLYKAHKTHMTSKCLYQYQALPAPDYDAARLEHQLPKKSLMADESESLLSKEPLLLEGSPLLEDHMLDG
jgi:hypothetical protein